MGEWAERGCCREGGKEGDGRSEKERACVYARKHTIHEKSLIYFITSK